jgi:uncharacterized protein YndB with AHSA1/START domain
MMDATDQSEPTPLNNRTTIERKGERELVVTRTVNGPARLVFEAWSKPELFKRWWAPKSLGMAILSCEMDVRVGGKYRLVFRHPAALEPMPFFGSYLEVIRNSRIVWTNEESGHGGPVSTVTFEERAGKTLVVMTELYPSKTALDEAEQKPWTASDRQQATLSLHTRLHHQAAGVTLARLLLIDGDLRTRRRCTLRSGFLRGRRSSLLRVRSPRHRHATQENRNPKA